MQRIQAFEAFVPSKSKILRPDVNNTVKSNVNVNTKSKVAGLFARLKQDRNALSIVQSNLEESSDGVSVIDIKAERPTTAKVVAQNLRTVTKFPIGTGPRNPKLICKLDIEANFDLKPILVCNDIEYPSGTTGVLRSCCLPDSCSTNIVQQKLRKWMDSQRSWLYPDRPVSAASMKVNGVVADLAPCDFWQEPSLQDVSYINITKRRRLKWQGALCSAVDELLLEPVGFGNCCNLLEGQRMESFYILGSDSEISDSTIPDKDTDGFGNQQAAKCLPMSAIFFRNHRISCDSDLRKNCSDEIDFFTEEDVSCILTGVKKSFIDRVIKLGANPMEMTDKQELIRITTAENRNKKPNRNISSAGRLQETSSGRTLYFSGSFALRIVADCLAEVVFSTIKTSKFLFDVPKIVSNWPFANGVRTPMYASFAQCSHKFSDISHKKSEEPSNGTENGSGNSGFLRSKVPRPLHRMFLTGIFNPTVLAELAEVLCALSEVGPEGNAEGKGDRVVDMVGTDEDGTQNMGTGLEASSSSSSRSIDVKGKYPFDISTLRNFDNAFLHPKSLVSGTISDKKKEDNSAEDLGPIATLIPAESARLPKIPMKFNSIIVDNLSSSLPYTVRAAAREPAESNSSGVGRLSLSGMNVLSSMYGTDDDYRDDTDSSLTNDPTWIATKRAEDRPYFIVRTASTQRMECFCHYLQTPLLIPRNRVQDPVGGSISGDTDNDSGSMLVDKREGEGIGAVATMDSYLPITEIRWPSAADSALFTAPLSAPSSLSSSSFASIGAIKKEDKVSVKNRRVSLEQPKNGSAVSRGYGDDGIIDADMLTGKKRKHPIPLSVSIPASVTLSEVNINAVASSTSSNNELDSYYDVVYGAKLPILCLIQAKHSKVIVREKMESENSGAVLNEMNKYEIYAPETLEDRQRKRMTM